MSLSTNPSALRSGRRVALVACYPLRDAAMPPQFISNHGMRMVEATLRASQLTGLEVKVWDLTEADGEQLVRELLAYDPDVIGFSAFMWSFDLFTQVAKRLKEDDPKRLIVFGGPSARPSMFKLPPYQPAKNDIDILVINEGETAFREIVEAVDRSASALQKIDGLAIPAISGWIETPERPLADLSDLASPYKMGLVPKGGIGVLQTYRGCPFTCSFCEWGTLESPKRVRSVDDLCEEFAAMDDNGIRGSLLVDAGLNLNPHGFKNLLEAAKKSRFFEDKYLISEVYPAKVKDEHLEFLSMVGMPLVGIGLQSFDNEVLSHVERAYDEARFEKTLQDLRDVASVAIEIILGLPGDSPENFRQTFERARSLPCALRVYHCVVLPSALMVRAPENYAMEFDHHSLKMEACLGWSRAELQAEIDFVTERAVVEGGETGQYFWVFSPPQ
ncbi:MAG: B12-binding domain-containing radical SAM protein [Cellvibrionaceae bacterium]|nr:B12-binding domain-containing radical SAM protein [Cellvibrionaceae bacterium]|tara:strand:+ start:17136 stop:18470 length:1335 start_codon:yes stop_codon:yes gene_type:complete